VTIGALFKPRVKGKKGKSSFKVYFHSRVTPQRVKTLVRKSRQNDATFEKKQERKEEKNQRRESFFERHFCVPLMAVFTVCDMLFGRKRRTRIGQYLAKRWARALRDDRTRFFAIQLKRARDGS